MVRRVLTHPTLLATAAAAALASAWPGGAAAFALTHSYRLSTLTGAVRTSWAGLSYDRAHRELYVLAGGLVHVFNDAGMEIYRFGDDEALGNILGIAALEDGDLVALTYAGTDWKLVRVDFRGAPLADVALTGLPAELAGRFHPSALVAARSQLYLADLAEMKVLVLRPDGAVLALHDLSQFGEPDPRDGGRDLPVDDTRRGMMNGFGVGPSGDLLFTVATKFKAYVVAPDGKARSFGQPGGSPGKFGIVAGIGEDEDGRIYVADTLKAVVLVFDRDLHFVGEWGYAGRSADRLLGPRQVAVGEGKVYVAQNGRRGVSVFTVRD